MSTANQKTLFAKEWTVLDESALYAGGHRLIAGLDEAGRGAWAGPVSTAAVILNPGDLIPGINDSKQIPPRRRQLLAIEIEKRALAWHVDFSSHEEVDRYNVLEATRRSMKRALKNLPLRPDLVLIDAVSLDNLDIPSISLIKGDERSLNIGAASILAKVHRDRWMEEAARLYPQYGFERHKGYGTFYHQQCLASHGSCAIHRRTFKPVSGITFNVRHQP